MLKACLLFSLFFIAVVAAAVANTFDLLVGSRHVWGPLAFGLSAGYAVWKSKR